MRSRTIQSFFTISLLLLPLFASAQYNDLLKNKDITWIAEFETDHCFDLDARDKGGNVIDLRYFSAPIGPPTAPNGLWLNWWIYQNLMDGELEVFSDAQLKKPLSLDQVRSLGSTIDTIVTFYPETFEEVVQVVRNDLNPDDIQFFRTRQIIYQDGRDGRLHTRLLALAPLVTKTGYDGLPKDELVPLAWMKMDDVLSEKLGFAAPFAWAANIKAPLEIAGMKTTKGEMHVQQFLYQEATGGKRKVVDTGGGHDSNNYLTPTQIEHMFSSIDTVITFDPATFEEHVQIVRNDLKLEEIKKMRVVQDWYYDPERHLLVNRLRAVAPVVDVSDENGNFRYSKAMYYLVN